MTNDWSKASSLACKLPASLRLLLTIEMSRGGTTTHDMWTRNPACRSARVVLDIRACPVPLDLMFHKTLDFREAHASLLYERTKHVMELRPVLTLKMFYIQTMCSLVHSDFVKYEIFIICATRSCVLLDTSSLCCCGIIAPCSSAGRDFNEDIEYSVHSKQQPVQSAVE